MDFLQTLTFDVVPRIKFLFKASQFGQLSADTSFMSLRLSSTNNLNVRQMPLWTCSGCPKSNSTYVYWDSNVYFFCCSYIYPNWVRPIPSVPCLLRDQNPSCSHQPFSTSNLSQPFSTSNPPSFSPSCTTNILFSCVPAENVSLRGQDRVERVRTCSEKGGAGKIARVMSEKERAVSA